MSSNPGRRREPWAFTKIQLWLDRSIKNLAASPTLTAGSGAPTASEPKGSLYLRTGGSTGNEILYLATDAAGTWEAVEATSDFGSGGIKTDVIDESTTGAGVTIPDGVELNIGTGKDLELVSDGTDVTVTCTGALDIGDGTASVVFDGAGALALTGVTTLDLDGSGAVSLESSGGNVTVAGDNVAQPLNLGTGGARDIVIGHSAVASISLDGGVGNIDLATDAAITFDGGNLVDFGYNPARTRNANKLSDRYELKWVAGEDGLVATNASAAYTVSRHFELQGTNASDDDCTYDPEGGLIIETDGADGDEVILWPHQDAAITPWDDITWGTDQEVVWECEISTAPASVATSIIWAGLKLTNTEVKATDADQVYFRYEDDVAAGNLEVVYTNTADGLTSVDTGVTVAVDTRYHLKLVVQSDRTVLCYVNGALVATTNALDDATDLKPVIGVAADGAAVAAAIAVHGQAISRSIGA